MGATITSSWAGHRSDSANTIMPGVIETSCRKQLLKFSVVSSFVVRDAGMGQEQEILDMIDELDPKKDVFIDIGAAMGRFSMYAASKQIPAIAIEPEYRSFDLVVAHKELNKLDLLTPVRAAVGEFTGPGQSLVGQPCANGRHRMLDGAGGRCDIFFFIAERQDIDVLSLNDVQTKYGGTAIKVDIDGAESELLRGGLGALQDDQIKHLIIELQEQDNKYRWQHQTILDAGFSLRSKHHITGKGLYNYWYEK